MASSGRSTLVVASIAIVVFCASLFAVWYFAREAGRQQERRDTSMVLLGIAQHERDSLMQAVARNAALILRNQPQIDQLLLSVDRLREQTEDALNPTPRVPFDGTDDALAVLADSLYRQRTANLPAY